MPSKKPILVPKTNGYISSTEGKNIKPKIIPIEQKNIIDKGKIKSFILKFLLLINMLPQRKISYNLGYSDFMVEKGL